MGTDGSAFLAVGMPADILLQSEHVTEEDMIAWRYLENGNVWDRGVQRRLPNGLILIRFGKHDEDGAATDWTRFLVGVKLWEMEKRGRADAARPIDGEEIRQAMLQVEMGLFALDLINPPKPRLLLCTMFSG